MSLKVVKNTVTWKENTRSGNWTNYNHLTYQNFEFEEFPGLKFSAVLCFPGSYEAGPIFKLGVVNPNTAATIDNLEKLKDSLHVKIEYSSTRNSERYEGAMSFNPTIESIILGFTGHGNNSDERTSFLKVMGHYWSLNLEPTTITYVMKFDLKYWNQNVKPSSLGTRLSEKVFLNKELSDVNIICEDKVFHCHKVILSQNEVFKSMLVDNKMLEKSSGEVKITDVPATALESLIYFFYHDDFPKSKITIDLLSAAHKYIAVELIEVCLNHMKANLTEQNAVEVMIKSYLINKNLFDIAREFVQDCQNDGKLVEMGALEELKEINLPLACEILSKAFFHGLK